VFRLFDGRPLTLAAVMAALLGSVFAIPIAWYLFVQGYHIGGGAEQATLLPLVVMAIFALAILVIPVGWYALGEFTYGREHDPKA
jgi:hypothetical protein